MGTTSQSTNPSILPKLVHKQQQLVHLISILGRKEDMVQRPTSGSHMEAIPNQRDAIRVQWGMMVLVQPTCPIQLVSTVKEVIQCRPTQLKGPHQSVGVRIPNSRGHTKVWEPVSPTQGATPKHGSPYPQLKGPHRSVGVRIPNSRGHTKAWESASPTQGASIVEERTVNQLSSIAPEG